MNRYVSLLLILTLGTLSSSIALLTGAQDAALASHASWQSKVDPLVLETAATGETEFIVFLKEQADLSEADHLLTKQEKGAYVYKQLTRLAKRTQSPLLASLESRKAANKIAYRSYWVANMIWVRGEIELVQEMANRPDVAHLYANPQVKLDLPSPSPLLEEADREPVAWLSSLSPTTVEWNIDRVKAPQVWASGFTGQGVVIGGQDTGYDWDHPALKDQYRGWDGIVANHNYNWHDAIHSGTGTYCKENWSEPCDVHGHGTHTMGTMVGDDGSGNQIGMAPGARWIGCRNMNNQGVGTPITYSECYQWFIAPTDLNNLNPRPDLAPDVINNSWKCPPSEGCVDPNVLKTTVENLRTAGIVTVHSAGNEGPGCETIDAPAGIYEASFTVGATDGFDNIWTNSSRGPVTIDGSNRLKPNVSAPGTNIRSSIPGTGYYYMQGTSMAAPHVTGLIALLLSAQPALAGRVDEIETLVEQSAVPRTIDQICGGIPGSSRPNNTYGWGFVDAWATAQNAPAFHYFHIQKTASDYLYNPGQIITYTIAITHFSIISPTYNVVLTDVIPTNASFISATLPHTRTGDLIQWGFSNLLSRASVNVDLVVQIPDPAPDVVVNQDYGVRSNEALTFLGLPVQIALTKYYCYLPCVAKNP